MANTGKQRSLNVTINKTIAGVQQDGYPHAYNGKLAFGSYAAIDNLRMATMPIVDYEARLADFKTYVEGLELGLDFAKDTVAGSEAYKINTTACPIL